MYKYEYKRVDLQNCFQSAQQVKLERDCNRAHKSTVDLTWHFKKYLVLYYATRVALIRKNCQMRLYGVMLISNTRATARN